MAPCAFSCAGVMDPERLVQCPYDKNHQIRACRFPYHLSKCRENNKKIAQELATCPYNARHRVLKHKLKLHISTCPDNSEPELFSGKLTWGIV
uniref:CHHC U11-48K-type domain-containing protein n=1 Tax=Pelusios castaneus TaxID=367368 RepID=A0A8C8VHS9_9SAUR